VWLACWLPELFDDNLADCFGFALLAIRGRLRCGATGLHGQGWCEDIFFFLDCVRQDLDERRDRSGGFSLVATAHLGILGDKLFVVHVVKEVMRGLGDGAAGAMHWWRDADTFLFYHVYRVESSVGPP